MWDMKSSQLKEVIKEMEHMIKQKSVCKGRSQWELGPHGPTKHSFAVVSKARSLCVALAILGLVL